MDLLRTYVDQELSAAQARANQGDIDGAWHALERAHILAQSRIALHVQTHWHMFKLGLKTRDTREVRGQLLRMLVAGPGTALNRAPLGNTGRSSVSAFAPMPITDELLQKLRAAGVGG